MAKKIPRAKSERPNEYSALTEKPAVGISKVNRQMAARTAVPTPLMPR